MNIYILFTQCDTISTFKLNYPVSMSVIFYNTKSSVMQNAKSKYSKIIVIYASKDIS